MLTASHRIMETSVTSQRWFLRLIFGLFFSFFIVIWRFDAQHWGACFMNLYNTHTCYFNAFKFSPPETLYPELLFVWGFCVAADSTGEQSRNEFPADRFNVLPNNALKIMIEVLSKNKMRWSIEEKEIWFQTVDLKKYTLLFQCILHLWKKKKEKKKKGYI